MHARVCYHHVGIKNERADVRVCRRAYALFYTYVYAGHRAEARAHCVRVQIGVVHSLLFQNL